MTELIGLEVLHQNKKLAANWNKVGLVCNQASIDKNFVPSWKVFSNLFNKDFTALFSPQHGIYGTMQDNMIESEHSIHRPTNLPIFSLYSETREPTSEMLKNVDTIFIDLQITGCRVYTFKATIYACLKAAKAHGKQIVILDRPNPLGGVILEGPVLKTDQKSFVGPYPIPMRHGLTPAEIGLLFNQKIGADLNVISCQGWNPKELFQIEKRPWVLTSPNLPTLNSVWAYPGTVLFEGTNISEGRGTALPFQLIGAPYIKDEHLFVEEVLSKFQSPPEGVFLRPCCFMPTFHKGKMQELKGLEIHVTDPKKIRSYALALSIVNTTITLYPEDFKWKEPPYEYEHTKLPIGLISGSADFAMEIKKPLKILNNADIDDRLLTEGITDYIQDAKNILMYDREFKT